MNEEKKIVILCVDDEFSRFLYNRVSEGFSITKIIIEDHQSSKQIVKRRIKRLGLFKVLGQILFKIIVVPHLKKKSVDRIEEIKNNLKLNNSDFDKNIVHRLKTVNSEKARNILKEISPSLVLVNGTSIISSKTINCIKVPFVNIHVGITPKYRGVHGGYWAVKNNDLQLFGVTLHYIDEGIDTGNVIAQKVIEIDRLKDSFITYPYLQYGEGLSLLMKNISAILEGEKLTKEPLTKESKIWSSPSVW